MGLSSLEIKSMIVSFRMEDSARGDLGLYIDFHVATHQWYEGVLLFLHNRCSITELF
jgi:hypothetical protein